MDNHHKQGDSQHSTRNNSSRKPSPSLLPPWLNPRPLKHRQLTTMVGPGPSATYRHTTLREPAVQPAAAQHRSRSPTTHHPQATADLFRAPVEQTTMAVPLTQLDITQSDQQAAAPPSNSAPEAVETAVQTQPHLEGDIGKVHRQDDDREISVEKKTPFTYKSLPSLINNMLVNQSPISAGN